MRSSASLAALALIAGGVGDVAAARVRQSPRAPTLAGPVAAPLPEEGPEALPPAAPPEVAAAQGPSGTAGAGTQRYDRFGLATWHAEAAGDAATASGAGFDPDAITAAHRTLPVGSIAEVTALDSGRTILVLVSERGPADRRFEIDLARGAAGLLGIADGGGPVRVRAVTASPQDRAALVAGRAASPRMDAPPALLAALRRQLGSVAPPARAVTSRPPRRATPGAAYAPPPIPARVPAAPVRAAAKAGGRYRVQVAAFSSEARARDLARTLGGAVEPAGALWRVRLGPFPDLASAQRARDGTARRGYGGAQIVYK